MERKLNIKVLLPEEVIEKYDIDEDTGVLSYFEDGATVMSLAPCLALNLPK